MEYYNVSTPIILFISKRTLHSKITTVVRLLQYMHISTPAYHILKNIIHEQGERVKEKP